MTLDQICEAVFVPLLAIFFGSGALLSLLVAATIIKESYLK